MKVSKCSNSVSKVVAVQKPREYLRSELFSTAPEGVYKASGYTSPVRYVVCGEKPDHRAVLYVGFDGDYGDYIEKLNQNIGDTYSDKYVLTDETVCFEIRQKDA